MLFNRLAKIENIRFNLNDLSIKMFHKIFQDIKCPFDAEIVKLSINM